uniref:ATPase inhibitor, mitochondrial n=1 Tax=Mycena chlorophos TaxID=658473 RepID=A0ABQ0LNP8_MYCCL|nr:predicted protein [Mycena chlorophos]
MLARIAALKRVPVAAVRYSSGGTVNSGSKGFKDKEGAQENEYARRQEAEQLRKLRVEIERKKRELEDLQKEHDAEVQKHDSKL